MVFSSIEQQQQQHHNIKDRLFAKAKQYVRMYIWIEKKTKSACPVQTKNIIKLNYSILFKFLKIYQFIFDVKLNV